MNKCQRRCPVCRKILTYGLRKSRDIAEKKKVSCSSCCRLGEKHHAWKGELHYSCPECGKELAFTNQGNLRRAQRLHSTCKSCSAKKNITKRGVPENFIGSKRNLGKHHSEDARRKISDANTGQSPSDESRTHMRLARIAYLKKLYGKVQPNHNPLACRAIDEYAKQHNLNCQHAENGGEFYVSGLGYWVDGYDKEKNVVIEVYENWHNREIVSLRDQRRKQEIIAYLGCDFVEIKL